MTKKKSVDLGTGTEGCGNRTDHDFRFKSYGLAPKSAADFAFLLHGFHFLSDEGTMAIILPHGVLFRGGAEERIRTKLLKDGNAWMFILPDFENLQVSEAFFVVEGTDEYQIIEDVYKTMTDGDE